jgi:hypothetical protein
MYKKLLPYLWYLCLWIFGCESSITGDSINAPWCTEEHYYKDPYYKTELRSFWELMSIAAQCDNLSLVKKLYAQGINPAEAEVRESPGRYVILGTPGIFD